VEPGEDVRPGPALPVLRDQHVRSCKPTKLVLLRGVDHETHREHGACQMNRRQNPCANVPAKSDILFAMVGTATCRGEPAHKAFGVPSDKVLEVGLIYTI
jgi:hypothetical protein